MNSNPLAIAGLDTMPPEDQTAITTTLAALLTGFATRDADRLNGIYTDDADWVNAFGSVKHGNNEIIDYLHGLFNDQNFNDGTLIDGPHNTLRRLADNVVIISTHLQVTGQRLIDGDTIELRDNRSLHVLHKQPDSAWRIASEMFSDSNTDQSYINHS